MLMSARSDEWDNVYFEHGTPVAGDPKESAATQHGVYDESTPWSYDGTLDRIHHALYVECRERGEREAETHCSHHR